MLCKKRWSAGLNQDFNYLNEFEAKFYCFGGDGGGGGGASSEPKGTKFRGGKISDETKVNIPDPPPSRPPSNIIEQMNRQRTLDMVNLAAQDSLRNKQNISPQDVSAPPQNAPSLGDIFGAKVSDNINFQSGRGIGEPEKPTIVEPVSFTTVAPSIPSLPSLASLPDMTAGMSPNVNTYSPPPSANPFTYDLGSGASVTPQLSLDSVGLQFNQRFKNGGVVTSGIGSLFKR